MLIKSKEKAEIFNDRPLFDVDILNNFIDEWFENPSINIDDLELPIGISVSFHIAIATELALAQKIVELKNKIDHEKSLVQEEHGQSQRGGCSKLQADVA